MFLITGSKSTSLVAERFCFFMRQERKRQFREEAPSYPPPPRTCAYAKPVGLGIFEPRPEDERPAETHHPEGQEVFSHNFARRQAARNRLVTRAQRMIREVPLCCYANAPVEVWWRPPGSYASGQPRNYEAILICPHCESVLEAWEGNEEE